jgi:hypothetical protein
VRWLGIDFSGDRRKWRPGCRTSNVWIADVRSGQKVPRICALGRVCGLAGQGEPFDRLVQLLAAGEFEVAGIDAPFSLPSGHVPEGGHDVLLTLVSHICGEPFPAAKDFFDAVTRTTPLKERKPLRVTERYWLRRRVNVRSTLWLQPRGGAPMTSACLCMLGRCHRPLWPWVREGRGILAETFPAAQLRQWGLAHEGYNGASTDAHATRKAILSGLSTRIEIGEFEGDLLASADALDSVLCALGAGAISDGEIASPPDADASIYEGWIAVHL